jgi:O-antigen ligase
VISATSYQLNLKNNRIPLIAAGATLAIGLALLQVVSLTWSAMVLALVLMTALAMCKMEAALVLYALAAFMPIGPFFSVAGRLGYEQGLYPSELLLGLLVFIWGIGLLFHAIRDKKLPISASPINAPLFVLIGASVFSFIAAQFTWDYRVPIEHRYNITQIAEIGLLCMPVAAYLLISNSLKDLRWVKAICCSVLVVGVIGFASDCPWIRLPAFFNIPWTGLLTIPLISFLYAYIVLHKELGLKQLAAACLLALVLAVQFRYLSWVVMWLSVSVSLCAISWYRSRRLFAVVISLALITCLLRIDLFRDILEAERAEQSLERFNIWATSFKMLLSRPLWGVGPDNFYPYYSHHYADFYQTMNVTSPHSNWLQILVQYGIIGLAAFIWFIVACILSLSRFYRQAQGTFEREVLLATLGTFAGMVVISGVGDYIFPTRANGGLTTFGITVYNWILLGIAFGLGRVLKRDQEGVSRPDRSVLGTG